MDKEFRWLHDQAGNIFDPLGYMLLIKLTRVSCQTDVFFTLLCKACFIIFNQQSRSFLWERKPLFAFHILGRFCWIYDATFRSEFTEREINNKLNSWNESFYWWNVTRNRWFWYFQIQTRGICGLFVVLRYGWCVPHQCFCVAEFAVIVELIR